MCTPATRAWRTYKGPRSISTTAGQRLLFKRKLPLFLRFTKVRSTNNFFPDQNCAGTEAAKPVPGNLRPCLSVGTCTRLWESPHLAGEGTQGRRSSHPSRVQRPLRHFPTPCRRSPERGFLGKHSGSSGSTRLVAQARLPIPFNTSRASYLSVASPGFPPTPGPAQPGRKRSLKLLKSREFQSERRRRDLNPSPQRGRGQQANGGGGRGSSLPKGEREQ